MASDVSKPGAMDRGLELQSRIEAAAHPLTSGKGHLKSPDEFFRSVRGYLIKASNCGLIAQTPRDVRKLLSQHRTSTNKLLVSVGSVRNFSQSKDLPHFSRKDGAWFDFQLEVEESDIGLIILWYDFEVRLADGSPLKFLRFDLNPVGHDNEGRALRSHMHLGSDDDGWSVPSPILSPFEVLDLFLHGLSPTGRVRRINQIDLKI